MSCEEEERLSSASEAEDDSESEEEEGVNDRNIQSRFWRLQGIKEHGRYVKMEDDRNRFWREHGRGVKMESPCLETGYNVETDDNKELTSGYCSGYCSGYVTKE